MSEQNTPAEAPQEPAGTAPAAPATVSASGVEAPAGAASPVGEATPAEAAPKKKGGAVTRVLISILVVAVAVAAYWFLNRDKLESAKVGDCLGGTTVEALNVDDLKIVTCGETDAVFKVVQKVEGKTKIAADINPGCTDESAEWMVWFGKDGEEGSVLCLAKAS